MNKTIEILVKNDGTLAIDAVGFKGAACDKATEFLEKALGKTAVKRRKPEYHRSARRKQQVGV